MKKYILSNRVVATEDNSYANHLIRIASKDAKYALSNLNKSHKTLGLYGVPGDAGYYVSEFEAATPGFMWASDKGLQILDDAGISYEPIKKATTASTRISANIELIDTIGHIKNDNGKFDVCVVETPYADMQLATYDPVEDEYDILETVKDLDDARKKATTQFKSQPEFVMASGNPFYDKLSDKDKRFVRNTERKMADNEDVTVDNICKLAYMTLPAEDIDHHATDLYIRKTPESTELINRLDNKALLSTFVDNIDHVTWYELPFCYDSRVAAKFENR